MGQQLRRVTKRRRRRNYLARKKAQAKAEAALSQPKRPAAKKGAAEAAPAASE